jgi:NTE family protein
MGPGEVFGEMSILSGLPVSATVVTVRETVVHVIDRDDFIGLLEGEPLLQQSLSRMLIHRFRERTAAGAGGLPKAVILVVDSGFRKHAHIAQRIFEAIRRYAPESHLVMSSGKHEPPESSASVEPPGFLAEPAFAVVEIPGTPDTWTFPAAGDRLGTVLERWRRTASVGAVLVLTAPSDALGALAGSLGPEDTVLRIDTIGGGGSDTAEATLRTTAADSCVVRIGSGRQREAGRSWCFLLDERDLDDPAASPLDWIARWALHREVGLALGSGAARGFAHLGILEVLEDARIPIDVLAGTSMGGIAALAYARTADAREATRLVRETIGANRKVRDVSWLPRSAFLRGDKVRLAARTAGAGITLEELERPVFVTAADIAAGERVVLDRGSLEEALLATASIPGLFPPARSGERMLVDGGLLGRVPVDLLIRRRCGLTMAVNVMPGPSPSGLTDGTVRAPLTSVDGILGLRHVISSSWDLLSWWRGATEAAAADLVIEAACPTPAYDFDSFDEAVEAGREAARKAVHSITKAVALLLRRASS